MVNRGTAETPPREFDGYQLIRRLGRGGMGEVHLALDTLLERQVAIKFITQRKADDIARTRFMLEARAFARLQHPNVVSIYRVGEVEGFPYLVSEYVQGKPLDVLSERHLQIGDIIRIASGIARGLAAAHKQGVIHRDIKPGNVMVTDQGEAKLLDFGIAKLLESMTSAPPSAPVDQRRLYQLSPAQIEERLRAENYTNLDQLPEENSAEFEVLFENTPLLQPELTKPGTAIGTPRYMAPEVWRGKDATFRSDIFSFGALMFYLCTGHPPHTGRTAKAIGKKCITTDAPALLSVAPDIPVGLANIVDKCLRRNPFDRYANGNELRIALAQLTPEMRASTSPEGNPFRGLYPFDTKHQNLFFGRDSEIRLILERLHTQPLVAVVGDSGVGKSSLCRAGILPRLGTWLDERVEWTTLSMSPGIHPVLTLSALISPHAGITEKKIEQQIMTEPSNVPRAIRANMGNKQGMVLFVDQLEELLTISDKEEAEATFRLLAQLSISTPGIRVLTAIRGDFLSPLAATAPFGDMLSGSLFFLRPMTAERIRETITGPAAAKGVSFESDQLVDTLTKSAISADGFLPLLQFTLRELWEAKTDDIITTAALAELGGVQGALIRHADAVLSQMSPVLQDAAQQVLMGLVSPSLTRIKKKKNALTGNSTARRTALDRLVEGRLVRIEDTADGPLFELAHESLIKNWPILSNWLAVDAHASVIRIQAERAAEEWDRLGRDPGLLWRDRRLKETRKEGEHQLSPLAAQFIKISRRTLRRARMGQFTAILLLLISAVALPTFWQWRQKRDLALAADAAATDIGVQLAQLEHQSRKLKKAWRLVFVTYHQGAISTANNRYLAAKTNIHNFISRTDQIANRIKQLKNRFSGNSALDHYGIQLARMVVELKNRTIDATRNIAPTGEQKKAKLLLTTGGIPPQSLVVTIFHQWPDTQGQFHQEVVYRGTGDKSFITLNSGTYSVVLKDKFKNRINHHIKLFPGDEQTISVRWPPFPLPLDMVYIPPGSFLYGVSPKSDAEAFKSEIPAHQWQTGEYLIGRTEVTYDDWLDYLEARDEQGLAPIYPRVLDPVTFHGEVNLNQLETGDWRLLLRLQGTLKEIPYGVSLTYPARTTNNRWDWGNIPVSGITAKEAAAYAAWLNETNQVPGARLCTEIEWERAARGADGRNYPASNVLAANQANTAVTYGFLPAAMGPDEVAHHPAGRSPFGLFDMSGNVWEWTIRADGPGYVRRGGGFGAGAESATTTTRLPADPETRSIDTGFRICADIQRFSKEPVSASDS